MGGAFKEIGLKINPQQPVTIQNAFQSEVVNNKTLNFFFFFSSFYISASTGHHLSSFAHRYKSINQSPSLSVISPGHVWPPTVPNLGRWIGALGQGASGATWPGRSISPGRHRLLITVPKAPRTCRPVRSNVRRRQRVLRNVQVSGEGAAASGIYYHRHNVTATELGSHCRGEEGFGGAAVVVK